MPKVIVAVMKRYKDKVSGQIVVEVDDLSFLGDRDHRYNWFQRHFHHHRLRLWLRRADVVHVHDQKTATDLVRYYFLPKDKVVLI